MNDKTNTATALQSPVEIEIVLPKPELAADERPTAPPQQRKCSLTPLCHHVGHHPDAPADARCSNEKCGATHGHVKGNGRKTVLRHAFLKDGGTIGYLCDDCGHETRRQYFAAQKGSQPFKRPRLLTVDSAQTELAAQQRFDAEVGKRGGGFKGAVLRRLRENHKGLAAAMEAELAALQLVNKLAKEQGSWVREEIFGIVRERRIHLEQAVAAVREEIERKEVERAKEQENRSTGVAELFATPSKPRGEQRDERRRNDRDERGDRSRNSGRPGRQQRSAQTAYVSERRADAETDEFTRVVLDIQERTGCSTDEAIRKANALDADAHQGDAGMVQVRQPRISA